MIRSFIRFDGVKPIAIGNQDMPPRGGYPEVVNYFTILKAFYFFVMTLDKYETRYRK